MFSPAMVEIKIHCQDSHEVKNLIELLAEKYPNAEVSIEWGIQTSVRRLR